MEEPRPPSSASTSPAATVLAGEILEEYWDTNDNKKLPPLSTDCHDIDSDEDGLRSAAAAGGRNNETCPRKGVEEYGELAPFIEVKSDDTDGAGSDAMAVFDPEIDVPLPRSHSEVVKVRAAKSAVGRRRAELRSSQVGKQTTGAVMSYCNESLMCMSVDLSCRLRMPAWIRLFPPRQRKLVSLGNPCTWERIAFIPL